MEGERGGGWHRLQKTCWCKRKKKASQSHALVWGKSLQSCCFLYKQGSQTQHGAPCSACSLQMTQTILGVRRGDFLLHPSQSFVSRVLYSVCVKLQVAHSLACVCSRVPLGFIKLCKVDGDGPPPRPCNACMGEEPRYSPCMPVYPPGPHSHGVLLLTCLPCTEIEMISWRGAVCMCVCVACV